MLCILNQQQEFLDNVRFCWFFFIDIEKKTKITTQEILKAGIRLMEKEKKILLPQEQSEKNEGEEGDNLLSNYCMPLLISSYFK